MQQDVVGRLDGNFARHALLAAMLLQKKLIIGGSAASEPTLGLIQFELRALLLSSWGQRDALALEACNVGHEVLTVDAKLATYHQFTFELFADHRSDLERETIMTTKLSVIILFAAAAHRI